MRSRYRKKNPVYSLLSKGSETLDDIFRNKRLFIVLIIASLSFLLLLNRYEKYFFMALLTGLGGASMIYQRFSKAASYIGFELCMMATVLTAKAYGPHYGALVGFLSITAGLIISGSFKYSSFISVLTLPLIGLIVPLFPESMSLLFLGVLMTLIYDAIILPLYIMLGSRVVTSMIFFVTHVLLNIWVFSTLAPLIYSFMV